RNILHRDLKPGNVMVGAFGEVLVVDWGLAKVLASRERQRPEEQTPVADAPGSPPETEPGEVLGTLAFMAPEPARGEPHRRGRASAQFALGGILSATLPGQHPIRGSTREELMSNAPTATLTPAAPAAGPRALLAVCRKALAAEPADRYDTVTDLRA